MRLPIRNKGDRTFTIFVEPQCDEHEVPAGGEAIVDLEDGCPHSIDIYEARVTIWDEGSDARVEVVSEAENAVVEALGLVRRWLCQLHAPNAADAIESCIDILDKTEGYLNAHAKVFAAFHDGFQRKDAEASPNDDALPAWRGGESLSRAYYVGGAAAYLNSVARTKAEFPGLGIGPFDTETFRKAFELAANVVDKSRRFETR
jgi:hypothetical protein